MTKLPAEQQWQRNAAPDGPRCRWCRRVLPDQSGPGRPRSYCSQPCRQWDWVARQRAREVQLSDEQLVMAREELNDVHDALYVLSCAVQDVQRDLADIQQPNAKELREMLQWILECAEPIGSLRLRP
jgi:hypothetical protein